jgi:spore coat polysaccharide biosynthesis predicted glycosyltransferase SpsG
MKKGVNVVFRVDESEFVGYGHMSRCIALTNVFRGFDIEALFICKQIRQNTKIFLEESGVSVLKIESDDDFFSFDLSSSLVVIDGYQFDESFWISLIDCPMKCSICIDDRLDVHYYCDYLICYGEGLKAVQFTTKKETKLFLGGRYLLLRPDILEASRLETMPRPRRALVLAAGGTDQHKWIVTMLTKINKIDPDIPIWVLSGRHLSSTKILNTSGLTRGRVRFFSGLSAKEMMRLYKGAQYMISPASTIMLESFLVGCPLISGWVASNQTNSLNFYDKKELIINVGSLLDLSDKKLTWAIKSAKRQSGKMNRRQVKYIAETKNGVKEMVETLLFSCGES